MKKYRISAIVETTMCVEVEANTFKDAIEIAYKVKRPEWDNTDTSRFEIVSGRLLSKDEANIPF